MDIISLKEDGTARVSTENWNSQLHHFQAASTPAQFHSIKCVCVCESVVVWRVCMNVYLQAVCLQ